MSSSFGRRDELMRLDPNESNIHTDLEAQNQSYAGTGASEESSHNSSTPCHAVFKYLTPLLLALLAMKYQGKTENPFETHTANMWAFIIATCIYCLALGLKEMQINFATLIGILDYVIILSGSLSSASLVSIILPRSLGWLVFIVWAIFPVILARSLYKRPYHCIIQKIENATKWVRDKFNKSMGWNQMQEPSLPTRISLQPTFE